MFIRILLVLLVVVTSAHTASAESIVKEIQLGLEDLDEVRVNPVTNKLYASVRSTNSVLVIDSMTYKQTASVMLGEVKGSSFVGVEGDSFPLSISVAVNSMTNKIYTANLDARTISVIDGSSDVLEDTINLEIKPFDVAVNETTNRIYAGGTKEDGSEYVVVLDGQTKSVLATIPVEDSALRLAVNSVTGKIYTSGFSSNILTVIDGATNTVTNKISVKNLKGDINAIAVDSVLNKIFVAFRDSETFREDLIAVIDGSSNSVISELKLAGVEEPLRLSVDEKTSRLFIGSFRGIVTTFDTKTNNVKDTTYIRFGTSSLTFDPNSENLFASGANNSKGIITVVQTDSNIPVLSASEGTALGNITSDIVEAEIGIFSTVIDYGSLPSNVRPFRSAILSALKAMDKALGLSKIECGKKLKLSFNRLKVPMLAAKKANQTYYSEDSILGDSFEEIQRVVGTDDIADGIPDVCGN